MVIFLKHINAPYIKMTPKLPERWMDKELWRLLTSQPILNIDSPVGMVLKIVNW